MSITKINESTFINKLFVITMTSLTVMSCSPVNQGSQMNKSTSDINYNLAMTQEILLTSEAGDKIAPQQNLTFYQGIASGTVSYTHLTLPTTPYV